MIDISFSHRLLFIHPHRPDAELGNSRHDGDQLAVKTEPCATRLAGNEDWDWQKLVEVPLHCWTRFNPGFGLNQSQGEMRRWWKLSPNPPNEVIRQRNREVEASGRDCPVCIRAGREVGSGPQSPLGVLKAVCNRRAGRDGGIGHSRGHWSCPGLRRPVSVPRSPGACAPVPGRSSSSHTCCCRRCSNSKHISSKDQLR